MCLKVRKVKWICKRLGLVQAVCAKCPVSMIIIIHHSVFAGMVLPEGKNSLKDYYSTSKDVQGHTQTLQGCFSIFSLQPGMGFWWNNFILFYSISFRLFKYIYLIDSPITSTSVLSVNFYFSIKTLVAHREEAEEEDHKYNWSSILFSFIIV